MAINDIRIAILGGRGMLGTDLTSICEQQGFDVKVFDLPEFDIRNPEHLKRVVDSAEAIINCAAYTNVDGAENEAELAYKVNAEAIGRLGAVVKDENKWLLHTSTDFVFDGRLGRPYVETDCPNPVNTYGKTKLTGEKLLAESGCRHCIIRLEWTYGFVRHKFVTKKNKR